jgi:hypothetical protein
MGSVLTLGMYIFWIWLALADRQPHQQAPPWDCPMFLDPPEVLLLQYGKLLGCPCSGLS